MEEEKRIKVLLVCAIGMSSSLLVSKITDEAEAAGVKIDMLAIETPEVARWDFETNRMDIVLVAPQVRYKRKSITQASEPYGTVVEVIDTVSYGMVDGEKIFKQIMDALEARDKSD
ncbi:MAG: PTS sugar transporter subunit IIB [Anaerolineaceae bacterium]|nr:MAG: PTS sugar transporter subunit IIB [Anaerolineaceae bacterium]